MQHPLEHVVKRAARLRRPVDVERGSRVVHRGEEGQPDDVVPVKVAQKSRSGATRSRGAGGVELETERSQAGPEVEDDRRTGPGVDGHARRVAAVALVLVAGTWARPTNTEEPDSQRTPPP